jgi:cytochrome P450
MRANLVLEGPAPTKYAQWLPPSVPPRGSEHLFRPRPFDADGPLPVISRYDQVLAALLNRDSAWRFEIPLDAVPEQVRHCTLDAAWTSDGATHRTLRGSLTRLNKGATPEASAFTRQVTEELLAGLLAGPPPWNLARVIYQVSMRASIMHTMQAPPLLAYAGRLQQLVRQHGAAPGGFFGIARQPEAENILGTVVERHGELPEHGLARHLADMHLSGPPQITRRQLAGQLWLLVASAETQATLAASLAGLLLETSEYEYARSIAGQPERMRLLVAEGLRLGIAFPAGPLLATRPYTADGQAVPAGTPCLASYAAANRDPAVFTDPLRFDPRAERARPHLAFGEGPHRCLGAPMARQFVEDVLSALLRCLPESVQLDRGVILRETGIMMAVSCLPVTPAR